VLHLTVQLKNWHKECSTLRIINRGMAKPKIWSRTTLPRNLNHFRMEEKRLGSLAGKLTAQINCDTEKLKFVAKKRGQPRPRDAHDGLSTLTTEAKIRHGGGKPKSF